MDKKTKKNADTVPNTFYTYIQLFLGNYSSEQREIIKLIFSLVYRGNTLKTLSTNLSLKMLYPHYSLTEMIQLSEDFIHKELELDSDLFATIVRLRKDFSGLP